ncbi:hypothetical protein [Rhodobacter ferrooxidans]|nr:hypothetical protein [Rhodobacter sp. SW2]
MTGLATASDNGAFGTVIDKAKRLTHLAGQAADKTMILVNHVSELAARSRSLDTGMRDLHWVVRTMSVVALNARVNAAALGGGNAALNTFTEAATGLVSEAGTVIAEISRMMGSMRLRMAAVEAVSAELQHILGAQRLRSIGNLCGDLDQFGTALAQSNTEGSALMQHVRSEQGAVATAAMALQIGDATRQRLEHVAHFLQAAATDLDRDMAPGAQILTLAAAQIRNTKTQHLASISVARDALHRAHHETAIIGRSAMSGGGGERERLAVSLQYNLGVLQNAMRQCRSTQEHFLNLSGGLSSGLASLLNLLSEVNDIQDRMDRIGMNAVIACSQLGLKGAALKEISVQLRDLAGHAARLFGEMKVGLHKMGQIADLTRDDLSGGFGEELLELATVGQTLCDDLAGIEAKVDAFEMAVHLQQGHAASEVTEGIKALAAHSNAFASLELTALALDRWASQRNTHHLSRSEALLATAWRTYTMQQERDLHARFFGAPEAESVPVAEAAPKAAQELSDIFF